jgi:eukaryotic-like serine/threonine-protein kinase
VAPAAVPAAAQVSSLREAPADRQRPERRRRLPGAALAGLVAPVVAALLGGAYLVANRDADDGTGTTSSPGTGGQTATQDPTRSPTPSPTPSPSQTPSKTPDRSPTKEPELPPATEDSMKDFVESYLETVTENPRAAWQRLTPAYQRASGGFSGYTGFWSTIEKADPDDIEPDTDQLTVSYDVEYERVDGSKTEEAVTLLLRRTEDGYLIAGQQG